jgi:hypothetical protein
VGGVATSVKDDILALPPAKVYDLANYDESKVYTPKDAHMHAHTHAHTHTQVNTRVQTDARTQYIHTLTRTYAHT